MNIKDYPQGLLFDEKLQAECYVLFNEEDLSEIAAIAQSSPGAIAINMTALAGYKTAGKIGLVISIIAALIPPFIILSIISAIYSMIRDNEIISAILRGTQAGVAALIVDVVIDLYRAIWQNKQIFYIVMTPIVFLLNYVWKLDIAWLLGIVIIVCILKKYSENKGVRL